MASFKRQTYIKKIETPRTDRDGTNETFSGHAPSDVFITALKAVRATAKKTKK